MNRRRRPITMLAVLLGGMLPLVGALAAAVGDSSPEGTLRQYADRRSFRIGTTIGGVLWNQDPRYKAVFAREFNSGIVFIFPKLTQPARGHFQFRGMDEQMRFAQDHDERLLGVTLVYRNQSSPPWLNFDRKDCGGWSPGELDEILKTQISAVVQHGGDAFYMWEPVDEPLGFGGGCWERILGRDTLIAHAFTYARQANPHALLLLNETFGHQGLDRQTVDQFFDIVVKQKGLGTPIDAVGTEMHLEAPLRPGYLDEFRYFLARARQAGVQAYVTEMDVYQGPPTGSGDPMGRQGQIYHDVVRACLQDSNCKGFYTWGITDAKNWPATRPRAPLPDARPLLFDENYNKKPAYYGVLRAFTEPP